MTNGWSSKTKHERVAYVGTAVIATPTHKATVGVFRSAYERHGTRQEGTCSFVLGETRAGKSTACEEFMQELAAKLGGTVSSASTGEGSEGLPAAVTSVCIVHPDRIERPVIRVLVDAVPTYKALFLDVASAVVGTRLPSRWSFTKIVETLTRQIKIQGTRMLVFDEVQHICEHRTADRLYKSADVFKILMKAAQVQLVLVGLPHAIQIQNANDQLREMTSQIHHVRPFAPSTDRKSEFIKFLSAVESDMPFDAPCDLSGPGTAIRIHNATEGFVGRISHLLVDATDYAIDNAIGTVDRAVLGTLLRDRRCVPDSDNVFMQGLDGPDDGTNAGSHGKDRSDPEDFAGRTQMKRLDGEASFPS